MQRLRPRSAKQATKLEFQESSSLSRKEHEEEAEDQKQSLNNRVASTKEKMMVSQYNRVRRRTADNPIGKALHGSISLEKEVLYYEALKLKQQNHKVQQQNIRLKTRIRVLEKENQKLGKVVETQEDYAETKSRSKLHSKVGLNVESSKMPAMKRLVREARDEVELLRSENEKLKKSVKHTRLLELQNENEVLAEEMAKMTALVDELTAQQEEQNHYRKQAEELEAYLKIKIQDCKEVDKKNEQLQSKLQKMEATVKNNLQKAMERERKFQKDLDISKRRLQEAHKEIGYLKSDLSKYRQERTGNTTSASSHNNIAQFSRSYRSPLMKPLASETEEKEAERRRLQQQMSQLKKKNEQLEKKNVDLASTLKLKEEKLLAATERQKVQKQVERKKNNKSLSESRGRDSAQKARHKNSSVDEYNDDFDQEGKKSKLSKHDLMGEGQDEEQEEILYQEQDPKSKSKSKSKPKSGKKPGTKKKTLNELKSLLTYRLIAQRYPFDQLRQDIEQSGSRTFSIVEVSSMIHNNPFFLNNKLTKQFLKVLSPQQHQNPQAQVSVDQLVSVLRSLIPDFQLRDPQQDDEMYLRVAQMVTMYAAELGAAFEQKKNAGSATISQKTLRQLFQDLELQKKYVDLIVAELSLVSQDLQHLDYEQFLNRFYIDKEDMGVQELDEQYEQDVSKTLNKTRKLSEDEQSSGSKLKAGKSRRH